MQFLVKIVNDYNPYHIIFKLTFVYIVAEGGYIMSMKNFRGWICAALLLVMLLSSIGVATASELSKSVSSRANEGQDDDSKNNDNFNNAYEIGNNQYMTGNTALADKHRTDTYVLKNVPAGKVINASLQILNGGTPPQFALRLEAYNKYHADVLAWSNILTNPVRRTWEALTLLAVTTGNYYFRVIPIAGAGTIQYRLHVKYFDPIEITDINQVVSDYVSSYEWNPGDWYRIKLKGDVGGMNEVLYINLTEIGTWGQQLMADLYIRDFEPETWSYWLNHSWWVDSWVPHEEVMAAAMYPGERYYYFDIQAYNRSGPYELRFKKSTIQSDGNNHPNSAEEVTYEAGNIIVSKFGNVTRSFDHFDWYKVYLYKGEGVQATLNLINRTQAIFRLSIYVKNESGGYDLLSSWTNKPGDTVLNRVTALTTNVTKEGWYYIGVIAQIGLVPWNVSNLADWTIQTARAAYRLDIALPDRTKPPIVKNTPEVIVINEDSVYRDLKLNCTSESDTEGLFWDPDFNKDWPEALSFTSTGHPHISVNISDSPEAYAEITPEKDWNGEANITFVATDMYGKKNETTVTIRVTPEDDPPRVQSPIPDFEVEEGKVNASMRDIDLYNVFTDPDLPPYGDDNLTFSAENGSMPVHIEGNKCSFGVAPAFPGKEDHTLTVKIYAEDRTHQKVFTQVNITVRNVNRGIIYHEENSKFVMKEEEVGYFDLYQIFEDEDGDKLTFKYLGGASENLTVEIIHANGTAKITPAKDYVTSQEILTFKASDPLGKNKTGRLTVVVLNVNDPPYVKSATPDPLEEITVNEGGEKMFSVVCDDIDNKSSELRYSWYVDDEQKTKFGSSKWVYKPSFDEAGTHEVKVVVSDGVDSVEQVWTVIVLDINRVPIIVDLWPQNNTEVSSGKKIRFVANATDPDGDELTFVWKLADGTELYKSTGNSSEFEKKLPSGKQHIIIVEVSDGNKSVRRYLYIKVAKEEEKGPGFEGLAALTALVVAGILLMRRRRTT